jgi:hypothetical protein
VLGNQRNRRNPRKFPNQVSHSLDLFRPTAVNRYEYGIDGPLADNSNGVGKRVPVNYRKAAAPSRIDPGPLDRQQDRCNCR